MGPVRHDVTKPVIMNLPEIFLIWAPWYMV